VHDANFLSKSPRQALPRELLQGDQAIGAGERVQRRLRIALDVFVDIGAAQCHDQRSARKNLPKSADAVGAAPGMQRDHQIRGRSIPFVGDANLVTELTQDVRPAQRRRTISGS
jgi:hypothetical protein